MKNIFFADFQHLGWGPKRDTNYVKNIFLQIIRHVWERRTGLRQLQPSFCLSLSLQVFLITIIEKITMHHKTNLLFGCARSFFETGPFSVPRRKTVFSQPDDYFKKPLIGWLVLFLRTQYGGQIKTTCTKCSLLRYCLIRQCTGTTLA